MTADSNFKCVKTYVVGLDEKLEGGIPRGHTVLVCGTSGSMKTSFTFNILYNTVLEYEVNGIYLSLEQNRQSIITQMTKLGMDLNQDIINKSLAIVDMGRLRRQMQIKEFEPELNLLSALRKEFVAYKRRYQFAILAIDSLDALYALTTLPNPRNELFHFAETLRELDVTTFLVSEMERGSEKFARHGVESFLVDGIIHLDLRKTVDTVNMYIGIVKMRAVKHDRNYYPLIVEGNRFRIIAK